MGDTEIARKRDHVLVVPYPRQGHINPLLQFSRRLASKGVKVTLVITNYILKTLNPISDGHVAFAAISDGHDDGGPSSAKSLEGYLDGFKSAGSRTLGQLIDEYNVTTHPVTCLVYDSILPWVLNVAIKFKLHGTSFLTQACTVNYIFFLLHLGKFTAPISSLPVEIEGLAPLDVIDLPSLVGLPETYPTHLNWYLSQYSNLHQADSVLVNTYYELEDKVIDAMSRECPAPILAIGPTVPSFYLDKRIEHDKDYGLNLYNIDNATSITQWLSTKPPRSVVYVSFGSMASVSNTQMEELRSGLKASGCDFLWVVRASEESKLASDFVQEAGENGLLVKWCPQLEVLANEAVGCFFTHCGWNSILEALGLGVPMIGMPQWVDQPTNAMLIQDVWKVGVRVKVEKDGLVSRKEIANCIKEVMVGERSEEIRENAKRWKELTKNALSQGGSSDQNIDDFISKI